MSTHSSPSPTTPALRNTVGKGIEISQGNLNGPASDAALREYCDKHYDQLLPNLAEKMHQEKVHQKKLKAVKAYLNFEEVSQHSESGTSSRRRDLRKRLGSKRVRSVSESPETRRGRSESPRKRDLERKTVFKRLENGVFHRVGDREKIITKYLVNISKRRAFWSLNEDIIKITILTTNTAYPSRKILRIRACTHQIPQRKPVQYVSIFRGTSTTTPGFGARTWPSPFGNSTPSFGTRTFGALNTSSSGTSTSTHGFVAIMSSSPFGTLHTSSSETSTTIPGFGARTSPSPFETSNTSISISGITSCFGAITRPSPFGSGLSFGTQSANLFQSSSPCFGQTGSPLAQTVLAFE
nr:hypothetical protein [Tanacetum cinerariifolium]